MEFMTTTSGCQIVGLVGFIAYLTGFAALQFRLVDGSGVFFSVINIFAAVCVLISLTEAFNLASALIQISWILIGIAGLLLRLLSRRRPVGAGRLRA